VTVPTRTDKTLLGAKPRHRRFTTARYHAVLVHLSYASGIFAAGILVGTMTR
jgi:hypothetical protein